MLHIPMNAFTSGPTGGGSWCPHAPRGTPRGISQAWWDVVCPDSEVVELSLPKVNGELGIDAQTSGAQRMMGWASKLKGMKEQCVKVVDGTPFDFLFMVTTKPASIWPAPASYGTSPTLTAFTWSALVTRAFIRNFPLVSSAGLLPPYLMPALPWKHTLDIGSIAHPYPLSAIPPLAISAPPLRGLLGLHIRRGDYETHCRNLAEWGTPYNTWNAFGAPEFQGEAGGYPALPDFHPPTDLNVNETLAHCYPSVDAILEKIHAVIASPSTPAFIPTHIFIATNGDAHWLAGLTHRLKNDLVGVQVSSSRDFQATMTLEERAVDMAVDMAVLQAAEVFIGNGWSSLTSNVVQLRLAGGRQPWTCRFW
ncbi:hypothetical protein C8F01DRAFT_1129596 [Mycena amicta]|nr:hypothetical protein C8F01DRAFT_1129596 [Mycena amicta]